LCAKFNNKSIVDRDSWGLWDIFQVFETAWESCNRNNNKNGEKKRLWDWEQVGIFGNFWEFLLLWFWAKKIFVQVGSHNHDLFGNIDGRNKV